ncbi:hybrid sensor histidine kinase/response regulator CqsR [Vibrio cholerae]|uniref:hybrid sensor histidine kinase/response regulator n=1 Tax=Vibrio cholerae TaxID=666 RepID=UPI0018EEFED8|nr:hybrid sensor histidine kinase/response regulator [Vibrio cholerae]EKF9473495.1 hybrid sensor histidine kinase/response regulator CqsR [Vibrio cholerae]EKF9725488.1 hybrid sensor histidine kinase/response regulator CqsR [Vibrio cholerae]HCF7775598.1 hybrid sensor histidine kinase/response regulator CqsR [Vibrio cholerae]HCF7783354.1 hybrid sensor histidine kinase/response regulator CqsR [Vibrio cholerae]
MAIRSSLKKKSILALTIYLAFFLAIVGTLSYWGLEVPFRKELKNNLALRAELLATQIREPLNNSIGVLQSVTSIGKSAADKEEQERMLRSLFSVVGGVIISGGLWPEPNLSATDPSLRYDSLFFNKATDGQVDQLSSWNNPKAGGYERESWYLAAEREAEGLYFWSPVYVDPYTRVEMITVSTPYYRNGQFAGVATVDLPLESLIQFVAATAEQYNLGVNLKDAFGVEVVSHNFRTYDNALVSYYSFGEFNWQIEVVNANQHVDEIIFDLIINIEKGLMPILLLCVMVGYFLISHYWIRPIVLIAKKVSESREGEIIDIRYKSQDEIRHLIDTFNQKTIYLEAEKVKAQASTKAKSAFLATLSHEIRTPMNGVLGTAQILLKDELTPKQRQHLTSLYESGEHMMSLLNEILDYSKIEQGKFELDHSAFPLKSIIGSIKSIYSSLCVEKGLKFQLNSEITDGRWYYGDKARLRQIIFNLLSNAVKFTEAGFVAIGLSEESCDEENYLIIKVQDTGIGIAQESLGRIFRPFEQAESHTTRCFGGTGLGLAIVKQIAELMNGTVLVQSEVGQGSCFKVRVRLAITEPVTEDVKPTKAKTYPGLRVLIVEDNRTNIMILEAFMRNKGFECHSVMDGVQAITALQESSFDLVLMDNHMPLKDGIQATREIRQLPLPQAKILLFGCTADVFKDTRDKMLSAGADDIIAKPIAEHELDMALEQHSERLYQFHREPSLPSVE